VALTRALVALLILARTARADVVRDAVDDARQLSRSLDTLLEVSYALQDPEELRLVPSKLYGELIKDPVVGAIVENVVNQYRGGYASVAVTAGVTADLGTPAAANASVDAGYQLPLCRVFGITASGLAGYADHESLGSYALGGSACLPLPADTVEVSYTHRENVRTSLLARAIVLDQRLTDDLVDVRIRFYRWLGVHHQVDVMPLDINVDVSRSAETTGFGSQLATFDAAPAAWHRRGKGLPGQDQSYRFVQVHAVVQDDDRSAGGRGSEVVVISPLIVDGIHLGPDATFGANLGFLHGLGREARDQMTNLVSMSGAHAELWVATAVAPFGAEVRATHTMLPTYDGQVVRDNRIAARMQVATPYYSARAEGFLGRDQILRQEPGGATIGVAGGAADVAWAALHRVHLIGRVEAARSLAAVRAADPVVSQWDFRATIGVTTHWDARWP
jgi:hypothetical protein